MTTEFVLRLDKKRAEHLKKEARKRRKTPNALMRQALDNLIGEASSNGQNAKGVGWKEHFEWLRKHDRKPTPAKTGAGWPKRLKHLKKLDREYGKKLPILDIVEQMRAIDMNGC